MEEEKKKQKPKDIFGISKALEDTIKKQTEIVHKATTSPVLEMIRKHSEKISKEMTPSIEIPQVENHELNALYDLIETQQEVIKKQSETNKFLEDTLQLHQTEKTERQSADRKTLVIAIGGTIIAFISFLVTFL